MTVDVDSAAAADGAETPRAVTLGPGTSGLPNAGRRSKQKPYLTGKFLKKITGLSCDLYWGL